MRYTTTLIALLFSFSLFGQITGEIDDFFVLGAEYGASTTLTDSTYQVAIDHRFSQLNNTFLPTAIQVGDICVDPNKRRFRVKAIVGTPTFETSVLQVVRLQATNLPPSGVGFIYHPPGLNDFIPSEVAGLISPALAAMIANHNAYNSANFVGGGGGSGDPTTSLPADSVFVTDAGGYYTTGNVEGNLQEGAVERLVLDGLIGDLVTLSGVPVSSTDLGAFTGTTIADNETIKGALQDLETYTESVAASIDLNFGKIWYVSETGNNSDGEIGNPNKPLATIWAARDSAVSGDLIYLQAGYYRYTSCVGGCQIAKNGVTLYGAPGSNLEFDTGNNNHFGPSVGETFTVISDGEIDFKDYFGITPGLNSTMSFYARVLNGKGYIVELINPVTSAIIEADVITLTDRPLSRILNLENSLVSFTANTINYNLATGFPVGVVSFAAQTGTTSPLPGYFSNSSIISNFGTLNTNAPFFTFDQSTDTILFENTLVTLNADIVRGTIRDLFVSGTGEPESLILLYHAPSVGIIKAVNSDFVININITEISNGAFLSGVKVLSGTWVNPIFENSRIDINTTNCFTTGRTINLDGYGISLDSLSSITLDGNFRTSNAESVRLGTSTGRPITLSGRYRSTSKLAATSTPLLLKDLYYEDTGAQAITTTSSVDIEICSANLIRSQLGAGVTATYCNGFGEWDSEIIVATASQSVFTASVSLPTNPDNISVSLRAVGTNTFSELAPDVYTVDSAAGTVTLIGIAILAEDEIKIKFYQ